MELLAELEHARNIAPVISRDPDARCARSDVYTVATEPGERAGAALEGDRQGPARREGFCVGSRPLPEAPGQPPTFAAPLDKGVEHWHQKQSKHRRRDQTADHHNR
jgi:hypothetical protein